MMLIFWEALYYSIISVASKQGASIIEIATELKTKPSYHIAKL